MGRTRPNDYQKINSLFPDYQAVESDQKDPVELQSHVGACPECREELESLSAIWTKLGVLPEEQPSPALRCRFYTMLEKEKSASSTRSFRLKLPSVSEWLRTIMPQRPAVQFALGLALLAVGLIGGYFLRSGRTSTSQMASLHQEMQSIRQTLAVSLLSQDSPTDRLRGVSLSTELSRPGESLLDALIQTFDTDPNVNVRLAAVDALFLFADNPKVKENLILSLSKQTSPLVQVALVDLLLHTKERRAVQALRTLIRDETINPEVKQRVEDGIREISY